MNSEHTVRLMKSFILAGLLIVCAVSCTRQPAGPHILIKTAPGDILIECEAEKAPLTTENFLKYVDAGKFRDACFYRVVHEHNQPDDSVKIAVIQGGLWYSRPDTLYPAIEHETTEETGIRHLDGTISMARSEPGSATSEFFICVGDMPELDFGGGRNSDGQGFAAFGRVIRGMDVIHAIHRQPAEGQMLNPRVKILDMTRVE